jgi:hypothetical protein
MPGTGSGRAEPHASSGGWRAGGSREEKRSAAVGRNQTSVRTRTLSGPVDGGSDTERPEPRHVRNQASRFFSAEKQEGEAQRTRRGRIFGASRRVRSNRTLREAPYCPSLWPLRLPSCFSVLKNLLALERQPRPVIGVCRLGNAKMHASRKALRWERSWPKRRRIGALSASWWKFAARLGDSQD